MNISLAKIKRGALYAVIAALIIIDPASFAICIALVAGVFVVTSYYERRAKARRMARLAAPSHLVRLTYR